MEMIVCDWRLGRFDAGSVAFHGAREEIERWKLTA